MVRLKLSLDESVLSQKMRDVFRALVDVHASYPFSKDTKDGFLRSIPSNYGYVFFWFGFLDEEALGKYHKDYVSKEKLREIEEAKKKEQRECEEAGIKDWEGYFSLSDHIRDNLFPMVYDHPDVIGEGFAEVYLAVLDPDIEKIESMPISFHFKINEIIHQLNLHISKLKKLRNFVDKVDKAEMKIVSDMELSYKMIKYADLEFERELEKASDLEHIDEEDVKELEKEGLIDEGFIENEEETEPIFEYIEDYEEDYPQYFHKRNGWEICLRINFNGDETLKEVLDRIDKIISPLKRISNRMNRYENSFFPF